jgi:outer membrane lipopolysaccharide assembly protein LptE/RlpB
MQKILTVILILFFLEGCGYAPMYSKNQKVDFYIQSIEFDDGDKDLANFIKLNLKNYFDKKSGKNFAINTTIKYQKIAVSKTAEAITEEYSLNVAVSFQIKSENIDKIININEISKMNNFDDEFEERKYEQSVKENMAKSIVSRLLFQLSRFNDN